MPARPALALTWRQMAMQTTVPTGRSRCLHTLPRRPVKRAILAPRHLLRRSQGTFVGNARSLFRGQPFSVTIASVTILIGALSLFYANYFYQNYIIKAFHKYPEPVAKKLRKALYYTNTDFQPQEAIKFYRQALQVAEEVGMDPFSDEVMGVKVQVASLMERVNQYGKAIQVLEILRRDSLEWIKRFGELDHNKQKRTRLLAKCVGISVKLGELYADPAIYDRDTAEECLVWAVETVLKEKQRRDSLHIKDEDEGPWMHDDEIGATLESLAHNYESKNQHYLATPLFLQALNLRVSKDCHSVVLMNNLASSLAQQSPRAAAAAQAYATSRTLSTANSTPPPPPPVSRESVIENARTWATKALDIAAHIRPPERNEECDIGCAVATHNLGEFAEMLGDVEGAKKRYEEAVGLARAIGFEEGVENSSARLRKVKRID